MRETMENWKALGCYLIEHAMQHLADPDPALADNAQQFIFGSGLPDTITLFCLTLSANDIREGARQILKTDILPLPMNTPTPTPDETPFYAPENKSRKDQVIELAKAGRTVAEIRTITGVSSTGYIYAILSGAGIKANPSAPAPRKARTATPPVVQDEPEAPSPALTPNNALPPRLLAEYSKLNTIAQVLPKFVKLAEKEGVDPAELANQLAYYLAADEPTE